MPALRVGERLNRLLDRIDLAAELIGMMLHPKDKIARQQRRSAFAMTLLGMHDRHDEPEAALLAKSWFSKAGNFKTASKSDPYTKQQKRVLEKLPKILAVGQALDLVWTMDAHHSGTLAGGASLNKAFAIIRSPLASFTISESGLRSAWSYYKPVAHFCAGFALAFQQAHQGPAEEIDERMKYAYVEELHVMVSLIAAYERFAARFIAHGQRRPLIHPKEIVSMYDSEPNKSFVPSPLPPELLSVAKSHRAHNIARR